MKTNKLKQSYSQLGDKYPFVVTITAYPLMNNTENDAIITLTSRHKSEDKICKAIGAVLCACQEMRIAGELSIQVMIEKDGEYFDSDETNIVLPENNGVLFGKVDDAGNIICSDCQASIPQSTFANLMPHICLKNGHGDMALYHRCPYCGGITEPEEYLT